MAKRKVIWGHSPARKPRLLPSKPVHFSIHHASTEAIGRATRRPLPKVLPTHLSVTASATLFSLRGLPPSSPSHPHPGPLARDPCPPAVEGCEPGQQRPLLAADRGALLVSDLSGAKQLAEHQAREPGRTEAPRPVLRLIPAAEPHSTCRV